MLKNEVPLYLKIITEKMDQQEESPKKWNESMNDQLESIFKWFEGLSKINKEDSVGLMIVKVLLQIIAVLFLIAISPLVILGLIIAFIAVF
jgi:hypothetical protein